MGDSDNSAPHRRLKEARLGAGHRSAAAFARANGFNPVTYRAHESGTRGLSVEAARAYAAALGVSASWLLIGEETVAEPAADVAPAEAGAAAPAAARRDEDREAETLSELVDGLIDRRRWRLADMSRLAGAVGTGFGRAVLRLLRWGLTAGPVRKGLDAIGARLPAALRAGGGGVAEIGRFHLAAAGRPGERPFPPPSAGATMPAALGWLRALTDAAPEDLAFVEMPAAPAAAPPPAPAPAPGDVLLVDVRARRYGRPGLYVARGRDGPEIVRLEDDAATGRLILSRPGADGETSSGVEPTDLSLAGRVIWLSRRV